jgi:homoserine dehydrogenase
LIVVKLTTAVLAEAQARGYAEADPAMDVDGTDAAQKLSILTQLAYGTRVPLEDIVRQGIQQIELLDLLVAAELGYRVKLLATSRLAKTAGSFCAANARARKPCDRDDQRSRQYRFDRR